MRVTCLAQDHNTMSQPGLEPRPLHLESSKLAKHEATTLPPDITKKGLHGAHLQFPAHHSSVGCTQQGLKEAKKGKNKIHLIKPF